MGYEKIDPIINQFVSDFGFRLVTEYKDIEVRMFSLKHGKTVFIDLPYPDGKATVQLTIPGKVGWERKWLVEPDFLYATLEKCLRIDEGTES